MAAVSLIHRLQRERGATSAVRHGLKPCQSCLGPGCPAHLLPACADHTVCLLATKTCPQWVASGDTLVSPQQDRLKPSRPCACGTGSLVADLRRRTDRLAHEGIEKELKLLRDQADRFSGEPQECARMLFATLTGYSNLIKTLIDSALETGSYLKAIAMHKELYGRQRLLDWCGGFARPSPRCRRGRSVHPERARGDATLEGAPREGRPPHDPHRTGAAGGARD